MNIMRISPNLVDTKHHTLPKSTMASWVLPSNQAPLGGDHYDEVEISINVFFCHEKYFMTKKLTIVVYSTSQKVLYDENFVHRHKTSGHTVISAAAACALWRCTPRLPARLLALLVAAMSCRPLPMTASCRTAHARRPLSRLVGMPTRDGPCRPSAPR